jgi:hypothetical protein
VLPKQRQRQLENRAFRLNDIAHAIRRRRGRDALKLALVVVKSLDLK